MGATETISTLNRSKENYQDIRDALESVTESSLENVPVEDYKDIISSLHKDFTVNVVGATVDGTTLITS